MQAQVRTIVALSGERLVVLPEAQYAALVDAAGQNAGARAVSPAEALAAMPAANKRDDQPARRAVGPQPRVAPVTDAVRAPEPTAPCASGKSLNDVLLFG